MRDVPRRQYLQGLLEEFPLLRGRAMQFSGSVPVSLCPPPPRGLDLEPLQQTKGFCGDVTMEPRFGPSPQAPYAHPYYWAPFILIGNWK